MPSQKGDVDKAVATWRPLADKGNADAAFNLGQAYRLGKGVPIDLAKAQSLFEQRRWQEALEELAISIRNQGVIQPIVVRPLPNAPAGSPQYEIIAGERRWRAAQIAGLTSIPAVIRRVADEAAIAMALIENIQRENLNPLEEARALQRLIEEFQMTHQSAAEAVGRSRVAVSNLLRLLELSDEVKDLVERREIEMGHARALLGLGGRRQQSEVAALVAKKGLSVRETEALVRRMLAHAEGATDAAAQRAVDPNIRKLQDDLTGRKFAY